jgi:hypothetical protein
VVTASPERSESRAHEDHHSPHLVLGLFSPLLGRPQPDWPPQARFTGFVGSDGAEQSTDPPPAVLRAYYFGPHVAKEGTGPLPAWARSLYITGASEIEQSARETAIQSILMPVNEAAAVDAIRRKTACGRLNRSLR